MSSPSIRLGNPRSNPRAWPIRKFSSLVDEFRYGTSNKSDDPGLPTLRIPNVIGGVLDLSDLTCVPVSAADEARLRLIDDDLLFVRTNGNPDYVGRCAIFSEEAVSASGFLTDRFIYASYLIRARIRSDEVEAAFIREFMLSPAGRAQLKAYGNTSAGQYNITIEGLGSIQVPVPPIGDQRAIVNILRRTEDVRRSRRKSIALHDQLAQSLFLEMFGAASDKTGWRLGSLTDVAAVQGGLQLTGARKSLPIEIPYLRVANVYRDRLNLGEIKSMRVSESEFKRALLRGGDLLVVEGHGNPAEIGRAAIWDGSIDPCAHQNHLIRVRLDQAIALPDYVCAYMNSMLGRRYLLQAAGTTSGLNTISVSDVKAVPVPIPPLERQRLFSERLLSAKSLKKDHERGLSAFDALFASLQQRAFRGEL